MVSINSKFKEKLTETLKAVLPILGIVLFLCFSVAPIPPSILLTFLLGALLLIIGMLFFNVGVELSMTPMGERTGSVITKSRNIFLIILISFIMGFVITISEPDLQVLAQQVPSIPNFTLISDKHASDDCFGLVSMCSIGPILAVLILGLIYKPSSGEQVSESIQIIDNTVDLWNIFAVEFPHYIKEMAMSILPIMKSIMKIAGIDTKAKSITFSLPVTDTAGLRLIEEVNESEEL